ncbi:Na(+)/H(+) antiporter subunit A [Corynebacterium epidermidicanis]|uniref:Na(+)/H(+) antiporter subunit A n=1 Tax=Corynebacterium epidermidicanis TaxID=1050174 RepID=A0A0G3GLT3_9CORY|nr:Na(+)/H(+) antiporter subunit A [Corynebacterium epidermidicanis]
MASPLLVKTLDRKAGWPLAALFVAAAVIMTQSPASIDVPWALGAHFALKADSLSTFFALLALLVGAVVFCYSAAYLPRRTGNTSFYVIMSAFMFAVLLLVLADDVITLFVGWELVSIASFLLIARSGSGGQDGSVRTLILTFVGGLTLLTAVAIASTQAGTTNLSEILANDIWANHRLTELLAILIAVSAFTKAAQFPFHFWLPEAMAAATPVSAFLHAAAVVKAGVYVLLRFSGIFHSEPVWNALLISVGLTTAVMGALFAIQKTDLKQLTAYSTVSHLGWLVATIGVGTPLALAAALVHTMAHALFKSSLFMLIGVVDHQTGTRDIRRLGPLVRRMPYTFGSMVVGALSMAAVPPLFGFASKEGMLAALEQSSETFGNPVFTPLLLAVAAFGALLTFTYSARIIFGSFIDGPRDMSHVKEAPVSLWLPAALPGLLSIPVAFALPWLDAPVDAAVAAIGLESHSHLALWHGINAPFLISLAVLVIGCIGVYFRKPLLAPIERKQLLPFTGASVLHAVTEASKRYGRLGAGVANSFSPARHLAWPFAAVITLGVAAAVTGMDGAGLAPRVANTDRVMDLLPFAIIVACVLSLLRTRSRISATILLSAVGVGVTLQILMLGAPDVALTQFLVELLVIVMIMMVLRHQPRGFHPVRTRRKYWSGAIAAATGVVTFFGVYTLLGRHERPKLAMWYLQEAPGISGGANVVNTILVEFRALDTMGELSVLGMAAVVIAAVVASIPRERGVDTQPLLEPERNALPLRHLQRLLLPVLGLLSLFIFMRGHNSPGGGFIAALVAASGFMLVYLAKPADAPVVPKRVPFILTGVGVTTALVAGFIGMTHGSFLYAIHGHFLGQHLTTSMIFDAGVYLAVLGMVSLGINALGGESRPGADELPYDRPADTPVPPPTVRERKTDQHDRQRARNVETALQLAQAQAATKEDLK